MGKAAANKNIKGRPHHARCLAILLAAALSTQASTSLAQIGQSAPLPPETAKNAGPSLDVTLRWLTEQLEVPRTAEGLGNTRTPLRDYVWFDNCRMTVLRVNHVYQLRIIEADLQSIDPESSWLASLGNRESTSTTAENAYGMYSPSHGVEANRAGEPAKRRLIGGDRDFAAKVLADVRRNGQPGKTDGLSTMLENREQSLKPRLVQAFQHAARLCFEQQKLQPAQAPSTKKPNEPF